MYETRQVYNRLVAIAAPGTEVQSLQKRLGAATALGWA